MKKIGPFFFLLKNILTPTFVTQFFDFVYEFVTENVWAKRTMHIDGRVSISSTARILYPENIFVGDRTNINRYCCLWASPNAKIVIGRNCLTGSNVTIITSKYKTEGTKNFRKNTSIEKDVIIEDDVWLGSNVVVLPGVKIGRASVIGAGTVVVKNVPPFSIVVGQEMRVIKSRK
jgi:acetyltransferase-like isoleucine patch superfamily enzyme